MRVLITGGTGFVGGWTAWAVHQAGHDVRFLVRDPAKLATTAGALGVPIQDAVRGDMGDAEQVDLALQGCDAVIHAAAVVAMNPSQAAQAAATNLQGARNVLGKAVERGLDPIVYVSSTAALHARDVRSFHADSPVQGGTDAYGQSKAEIERYARTLQASGAPVVITYPAMVLGPPAGTAFGEAAEGISGVARIGVVPGRHAAWTVVDVRDLGQLHAATLRPGLGPRRYVAGGERLKARQLSVALSVATGRKVRHLPVPDRFLRGAGWAADRVRSVLPTQLDQFTEAGMQYYTVFPACENQPSRSELGVRYRPALRTFIDTAEALRLARRLP